MLGEEHECVMIITSLLNSEIFLILFFIIHFPILFNLGKIQKAGGDFYPPLTQLGSNCFHSPCVDAPGMLLLVHRNYHTRYCLSIFLLHNKHKSFLGTIKKLANNFWLADMGGAFLLCESQPPARFYILHAWSAYSSHA